MHSFRVISLFFVTLLLSACFPANESLEFNPYILTSISVSPASSNLLTGTTQQYRATGTFQDGTQKDITQNVTWSSSNDSIAKVVGKGLVEGLAAGQAIITASKDTISGGATLKVFSKDIAELVILPNDATKPKGSKVQYKALVYLTSRSSVDVTDQVTWSSADSAIVSINSSGFANYATEGTTTITATFSDRSSSTSATVTNAELQLLVVAPIDKIGAVGTKVQ